MALAQQLAELALANSQGLLDDDEYRLLRRNLFEQDSTLVPVEKPILSVAGPGRTSSSYRVRIVDTPIEPPPSRKPSLRRNNSFTTSMTNLLKRGGGDKTPASYSLDPPSAPPTKRSLIPRLHRKANQLFSARTDNKRLTSATVKSSSFIDNSNTQHPPHTPSRPSKRTAIPTVPPAQLNASSSSEIFDDRNLYTAKDIRAAIIATEAETQWLLEAFNDAESLTSFRVSQQNARRLRAPTPEHVTAVMNGSNWRKYAPAQFPPPERKVHYPGETVTDNSSIRSISPSITTSLSRSKSISSLRSKHNPTSPLSARTSTSASSPPLSILRKNSMSSVASQARFGVSSNTGLSRSSGHLPLWKLAEGEYVIDANSPEAADIDSHPEVFEVQRLRDGVIARCNARLEYLQARLKTAELHERVLRR